jgi:hypothetical protein
MSRNTKIILIVVAAAVVLLCLCASTSVWLAAVLFRNVAVNSAPVRIETAQGEAILVEPRQAEATGGAMPSFTLPAGWLSDYSMKIAGFQLAGYKPENGTGHLVFAVIPETSNTSVEDLERQIQSVTGSQGYRWNQSEMKVVERRSVTVRDQASELVISEGNGSGGAWRQAVTTYRGDQGLVLVIYGMPQGNYDQGELDALLASIQ